MRLSKSNPGWCSPAWLVSPDTIGQIDVKEIE